MDLSNAGAPKSDQQNYVDYISGPRIVTVAAVRPGSAEQEVVIELVEYPGRPYKPNKTMIRLLKILWGANKSNEYVGRKMKLVGNPEVLWAGKPVGGIEIEELSDLEKMLSVVLPVGGQKYRTFRIKPLETINARDWLHELELAGPDLDAIGSLGAAATAAHAGVATLEAIRARYKAVNSAS